MGVERADGRSKKTQETLYGYRGEFVEVFEKEKDRRFQVSSSTTFTPHPDPLPQGERGDNF